MDLQGACCELFIEIFNGFLPQGVSPFGPEQQV